MKVADIKKIAKSAGVKSISGLKKKVDLIRAIQVAEGNTDCFEKIQNCALVDCTWFGDCQKGKS